MFEKVNPGHPDKMADRLAGAVVDLVYEPREERVTSIYQLNNITMTKEQTDSKEQVVDIDSLRQV